MTVGVVPRWGVPRLYSRSQLSLSVCENPWKVGERISRGGSVNHFLASIGALLLGGGLVLVAVGLYVFFRPSTDESKDETKIVTVGAAVAGLGAALYALNK